MNTINKLSDPILGRYELQQLIGKGTFGEVYKAFDNQLQRHVAIKIVMADLAQQAEFGREAIIREARIMARAEHTHIVPVHDVVEYDGSILIIMRLIHGDTLNTVIRNLKMPLTFAQSATILRKILHGMDFAHTRGIVHLDLKPGNIFLSLSDEILIMDFGIATLMEEQSLVSGKPFGTPYFMSPEQINCSFLDARSDIYSIGIIFYTMLTGIHPFAYAKSIQEVIECHLNTEPVKPSHYVNTLPPALDALILKALSKSPKDRFNTCWEFAYELEAITGLKSERINEANIELRWDNRSKARLKAHLRTSESPTVMTVEIVDISVGGAKLKLVSDIAVSNSITIDFYLPGDSYRTEIKTGAVVKRIEPALETGCYYMGIEFQQLSDLERYRISIFVRNRILSSDTDVDIPLPEDETVTLTAPTP